MSANNNGAESGRSTGFSSFQHNSDNNITSMELSPPRYSSQKISNTPRDTDMSTLTMRAHSVLPSARELLWDDRRPLELPSRPRSQVDRIELPSIRQAVPELHLRVGRDDLQPRSFSPPTSRPTSAITPTNYAHSPSMNKRRRLSIEEERDSEPRDYPGSRVYRSPPRQTRPQSGGASPSSSRRISESWSGSNRTSPYLPPGGLPSMRSPPPFDTPSASRAEWRPTLPSLPALTLERSPQPSQTPRARNNWSEYALDASHPGAQTYSQAPPSFSPPQSNFHPQSFSYSGYQQPRNPSYSGPSAHSVSISHDRTPFSSLGYHPQNLQATHEGYLSAYGDMVLSGDSKTRKRRGNLPKETTDKLRAWFVAHLQHPYPTEDEKQELMRLTGLQMNQISNWFINARRRQLPTMINNARAESDARSARSADGAAQGTGRGSVGLGESEGEYEDEFETSSMGKREPKSI